MIIYTETARQCSCGTQGQINQFEINGVTAWYIDCPDIKCGNHGQHYWSPTLDGAIVKWNGIILKQIKGNKNG